MTETTSPRERRQPCRRGGALVLVVERCLQRPTPSRRAFFGLCRWPGDGRLGRQPPVPKWTGTPPRQCRRGESSAPDAVAAWPLRRGGSNEPGCGPIDTAECARPRRLGTQLAIAASTSRAPHPEQKGKGQGEGSVRTAKPAPSEYPHATALGKFAAPRQNPHVLPPGFGSTHPKGGSIGFG